MYRQSKVYSWYIVSTIIDTYILLRRYLQIIIVQSTAEFLFKKISICFVRNATTTILNV